MLELIKTYYPINEQLKQFIYCYYLISDTPDDLHNLHYSFPHTFNAVSIYKSAFVTHQHRHFTVTGADIASLAAHRSDCRAVTSPSSPWSTAG